MKYIVTGATGHIGNNLVKLLLEKGHDVTILIRNINDPSIKDFECQKLVGDLSNLDFVESSIEKDTIVIHSAGVIDITEKQVDQMMKVNVDVTINLVQTCIKKQVKKFIYLSSTDAIPGYNIKVSEPEEFNLDGLSTYYGITKGIASDYVLKALKQGLLEGCIICPSAVLGTRDFKVSSQGSVVKSCLNKKLCFYTRGNYNFVDVEDVCLAIYNASINSPSLVYLVTGVDVTIKEFFKTIYRGLGKKPIMIYSPYWLTIFGTWFSPIYYKLTKKKPVYTKMAIKTLNDKKTFDNTLAKKELGLKETEFQVIVNKTIEWFKRF